MEISLDNFTYWCLVKWDIFSKAIIRNKHIKIWNHQYSDMYVQTDIANHLKKIEVLEHIDKMNI